MLEQLLRNGCALVAALMIAGTAPVAIAQDEDEDPDEATMELNALSYVPSDADTSGFLGSGLSFTPETSTDERTPNTFSAFIPAEAKMAFFQTIMQTNPLSLRDMINLMVVKKKVLQDITFDEVIESLQLKANEVNMRAVGHNTPYIILREIVDPESPRIEILNFCDLQTMRMILDYVPEFAAFVPCRITVMEDAHGDIWIVSLDWDVRWMDTSPNPVKITPELRERAISVRERIDEIMEAAANGDL